MGERERERGGGGERRTNKIAAINGGRISQVKDCGRLGGCSFAERPCSYNNKKKKNKGDADWLGCYRGFH